MTARDDYPTLVHWLNGGPLTGWLDEQMKVEAAKVLNELDRLRSNESVGAFRGGWQGSKP